MLFFSTYFHLVYIDFYFFVFRSNRKQIETNLKVSQSSRRPKRPQNTPDGQRTLMTAGLALFLKLKMPVLETVWSRPSALPTCSSRTSVPVKPSAVASNVRVMHRLLVLNISITYHSPVSWKKVWKAFFGDWLMRGVLLCLSNIFVPHHSPGMTGLRRNL